MEGLADQVVYAQILARLAPCPDPRALMRKEWWSHGSLLHTYGLNLLVVADSDPVSMESQPAVTSGYPLWVCEAAMQECRLHRSALRGNWIASLCPRDSWGMIVMRAKMRRIANLRCEIELEKQCRRQCNGGTGYACEAVKRPGEHGRHKSFAKLHILAGGP